MTVWSIEESEQFVRDLKYYNKKKAAEVAALLENLSRFKRRLEDGENPSQITGGYMHKEPKGIRAISQQGKGNNLQESRLYIYACEKENVLYLITIGNKQSQPRDIAYAKKFVTGLP